MTHIFVYGTPKKGQPNHYRMFDVANGEAEFLASARTVRKYPLVIAGECNIPFLLDVPGEGHRVRGEIYRVDDRMLKFLDDFEMVPAMYQRTLVELEVGAGEGSLKAGSVVEAFVYSTRTYQSDWPFLPHFEDDDVFGDHGLHCSGDHMTHIFVYGTLKKGQPNHYRMFDVANGEAEFLASARTVRKYPLVIAGECNIPFLLDVPGEGHRVRGEIYSVDDRMLKFLDDFEMVPAMYQRTLVELEVGAGEGSLKAGSVVEAFVYSTRTYQSDWPFLPHFEDYDAFGDHGLQYVSREMRD